MGRRYLDRKGQTGHWLVFFSLQGPLVILESYVKRHCGFRLPRWCQIVATISLLMLLGHFFFFPPAHTAELDDVFFASIKQLASTPLQLVS